MRKKKDEAQAQHILDQEEGKDNRQFAVLPYMKGITERLQWEFNKHDIKLYSKAGYTVRDAMVSLKHPLEKHEQCGVI